MGIIAAVGNYLESHRNLRTALLVMCLIVASVSLYMAVVASLFMEDPGWMIPVSLFFAFCFDVGTAFLLRPLTRRSIWLNLIFASIAVVGGAIIVSMAVWRGHWIDTTKELVKELLHI